MDGGANNDMFFLADEKFDFDVSLSPASSTGEDYDDEVFIGPVGHKEKCISVNVTSSIKNTSVRSNWSPLSGDQLEAICEEAQKLAYQMQHSEPAQTETTGKEQNNVTEKNEFVQDSVVKLSMLCCDPPASPIKRQTFCIQESPLKQLPPAIQSHLLRAPSPNSRGSTARPTATAPRRSVSARPTAPKRLASPADPAARTKPTLRGKTGIGVSGVLPSRPPAPTQAPRPTTKSQTNKTRLQPLSKVSASWRRSPDSSLAGSFEDLHSDSASVASDISDSSLNSSFLGKRTLGLPAKSLRSRSGVKPPVSENRRLTDRRNTSSSSSSVSSFNSSISLSPATKVTKPTDQSKQRRSVVCKPSDPPLTAVGRRSLSVQNRRASQTDLPKMARGTPLKRAAVSPTQNTPAKRVLLRTTSVPATGSVQNGLKTKPKQQALVPPTPSGMLRGGSLSPDTTKMLKPKTLSANSVDSVPQKPSLGALTPSGGSSSSLQLKARRPSGLPTPLRSRLLGLRQPTPPSQVRPTKPLPKLNCALNSLTPTEDPEAEVPAEVPLIQPFNLEQEEPKHAPPTATQADQSENTAPEALCLSQSGNTTEEEQTVETSSKTQEMLLLDLPAPVLQPQEKLLIDLSNTPELIRTNKTNPSANELIDLSSPLIKWSPVKKKNDAPLINLSF